MHCHIYTATPTVACLPIIVPLRTATVELTKLGFLRPTPADWVSLRTLYASVGLKNLSLVSSTVAVRNGTIIGKYATVCVAV